MGLGSDTSRVPSQLGICPVSWSCLQSNKTIELRTKEDATACNIEKLFGRCLLRQLHNSYPLGDNTRVVSNFVWMTSNTISYTWRATERESCRNFTSLPLQTNTYTHIYTLHYILYPISGANLSPLLWTSSETLVRFFFSKFGDFGDAEKCRRGVKRVLFSVSGEVLLFVVCSYWRNTLNLRGM